MTATDLRVRLGQLVAERLDAADAGLLDNETYTAELEDELEECRQAYIGLAVTEIATLRAELDGPLTDM